MDDQANLSPLALARRIPEQALAVPLDAAGRVDADLPCRKCGYNLRGQLAEGICPECATPVGRALQGDYLKFADPKWLETLASGMNWILWGVVVGVITGGLVGGGVFLCMALPANLVPFLVLPLGLIPLIGYWKITTPDPSGVGERDGVSARRLIRVTQPLSYAVTAVQQFSMAWRVIALVQPVALLNGVVGIVNVLASFTYGRQLALRIPDPQMARGYRTVMWAMVAGLVLWLIWMAWMILSPPVLTNVRTTSSPIVTSMSAVYVSPQQTMKVQSGGAGTVVYSTGTLGPSGGALLGVGCAFGIFSAVFGIWAIVLFFRLRRALINAAQEARATWASKA